jgi:8-oxo-dGTP pyrophosphatase MutT (NUDIX family)
VPPALRDLARPGLVRRRPADRPAAVPASLGRDLLSAPDDRPPIETLGSRTVYENRWLSLREDRIRLPDGSEGIYGVVDKPPFALVVPWDGERLHLVGQWRYTVQRFCWEFPQGALQDRPDAPLDEVARIELAEETGLHAGSLERIGEFYAAYGYASQTYAVFLATQLTQGDASPEPEEVGLGARAGTVAEFEEMMRRGEMPDAHSAAAYGLLRSLRVAGFE